MPKPSRSTAKFLLVTPEEASGQRVPLTARRKHADIYIKELWLNDEQRVKIEAMYTNENAPSRVDRVFNPVQHEEQLAAASLLASEGLDLDGRAALSNRWSSRWVGKSGKGAAETRRELFQWYVPTVSAFCYSY